MGGGDGDKSAPSGPRLCRIGGVQKRVVTFEDINARFALLEPAGSPSVYVVRGDATPIADSDLKRRLENEVVVIGEKDGARSISQPILVLLEMLTGISTEK